MENKKSEEAVSPVIGVILMVVITVIIAAILAVFAFGIGGPAKAPEAQLKFTATGAINDTTNPATVITAATFSVNNGGGDSLTLKDEKLFVKDWATGNAVSGLDGVALDSIPNLPAGTTYLTPGNTIASSGNTTVTAPIKYLLKTGQVLKVQVLDVPTGQMVSDSKVTVQ